MRIIAGKLKGSTLHVPQNKITRPLKDRARESIFNLLTHSNKMSFQFEKSNILDLYAGTGSFGLECLSRQARSVCFIEKAKDARKILEKNIEKLEVKKNVNIFIDDVFGLIKRQNIFKLKNIPFRHFVFNKSNEEELGMIFTFFVLETILLARLMNVNPFDQPAVEQVKIETRKILSR